LGGSRIDCLAHGQLPQQSLVDSSGGMLFTPSTGLSVTSATPVLKKSRPDDVVVFSPPRAILATASMPSVAIFSGYCCAVAPITPALTLATPAQPPSTETIVAVLPAAFSAPLAPTAVGSLIV